MLDFIRTQLFLYQNFTILLQEHLQDIQAQSRYYNNMMLSQIRNLARSCPLRIAYKQSSLIHKVTNHPYYRLCRYDKPIGCMLLYWPVAWGLAIGSSTVPPLSMLAMFLMGAWTSRSAGCIINDYFDRQFDRNVQRCKNRPLASGEVTLSEAAKLLFVNLCGGLFVLTQIPLPALFATFAILPIAALYPLAKRYTKYPQLILGLAFNSGVFIGALTLNPNNLDWIPTLLIYSSGVCWTMVYDTVYAFQDISDDKKLGLYSTALTWQKSPKTYMNIIILSSLILASSSAYFDPSYLACIPGFIATYGYLYYHLAKLDLNNRAQCGQFFKKNNKVGFFIFLSIIMKGIYSTYAGKKDKQ